MQGHEGRETKILLEGERGFGRAGELSANRLLLEGSGVGQTVLVDVSSEQELEKRSSVCENQVAGLFRLVQGY
jgi:hypothetical protein